MKLPTYIISLTALSFLLVLTFGRPASAEIVPLNAILMGMQEVPSVTTSAVGGARILVDTDANTLSYEITFASLIGLETSAHIHGPAGPGQNGGVAHSLPMGNPKVGVWNYNEAQESDILAGLYYINIHSSTFPAGELRGQINHFNTICNGDQVIPPSGSSAMGWGTFNIDRVQNQLTYYLQFTGITSGEIATHIHARAIHGAFSAPLEILNPGMLKTGVWNYDQSVENDILDGLTSVWFHSDDLPGGEVRGQISPYIVPLNSTHTVPNISAPASAGVAIISLDRLNHVIGYDVDLGSLSSAESSSSILGFAPRGLANDSDALFPMPLGLNKRGALTYELPEEQSWFDGLTYINVASINFPDGEIRGQIEFPAFPPLPDLEFIRGDGNGDGALNVGDVIHLLAYVFSGESTGCLQALNANNDASVNIGDAIHLLGYLFGQGLALDAPFPDCGFEATSSGLTCLYYQCP